MNTNTSFTELMMTQRLSQPPQRTGGWATRGGLFDLLLVAAVVLVVGARTPAGALVRYVGALTTQQRAEVPKIRDFFTPEVDLVRTSIDELDALPPEPTPPPPDDDSYVPEPWRSAVRASLAGGLPPYLKKQLLDEGRKPTPDQALEVLDEMWVQYEDPEVVLEVATLGEDLRERAIRKGNRRR